MLQFGNLAADGRWRNMDMFGRLTDRAGLRRLEEVPSAVKSMSAFPPMSSTWSSVHLPGVTGATAEERPGAWLPTWRRLARLEAPARHALRRPEEAPIHFDAG